MGNSPCVRAALMLRFRWVDSCVALVTAAPAPAGRKAFAARDATLQRASVTQRLTRVPRASIVLVITSPGFK